MGRPMAHEELVFLPEKGFIDAFSSKLSPVGVEGNQPVAFIDNDGRAMQVDHIDGQWCKIAM